MTKRLSRGSAAARGPRQRLRARLRFAAARALKLIGRRQLRGRADYLEFIPEARDAAEFADLSTRAACYLGDAGIPLFLPGRRFEVDSDTVPYFEPSLVRDPGWLDERPAGNGAVVVHRLTPETLKRVVTGRRPSTIVDGRLHMSSELEYFQLRTASSWPTYDPVEFALERLHAIPNSGRRAFVMATGPSAQTVELAAVDADIRIICNSAVRDEERLLAFRPNVIACTDPVFHIGPSRYADGFRRDLVRAAQLVDAVVVCGADWAGPLLGLAPELRDRLIVIPSELGGPWRWPTRRNPTVRTASSVLTVLMLPIALMLADEIGIAGTDGRQPSENYFWTHSDKLQYSDEMMQTVFDAHPAFFRDRDYEDYYETYCDELESLIRAGEKAGKTVRGAAPSWIPALQARGASAPAAPVGDRA
jgi:hypothetical protein